MAYVAATRARDLLVVPAVGDEARAGWVEPLNKAVYPRRGTWRDAKEAGLAVQPSGKRNGSGASRPSTTHSARRRSILVYTSSTIEESPYSVVWWDPAVVPSGTGSELRPSRQMEILTEDEGGHVAEYNLARYQNWSEARSSSALIGEREKYRVETATEVEETAPGERTVEVEFVADRDRPLCRAAELPAQEVRNPGAHHHARHRLRRRRTAGRAPGHRARPPSRGDERRGRSRGALGTACVVASASGSCCETRCRCLPARDGVHPAARRTAGSRRRHRSRRARRYRMAGTSSTSRPISRSKSIPRGVPAPDRVVRLRARTFDRASRSGRRCWFSRSFRKHLFHDGYQLGASRLLALIGVVAGALNVHRRRGVVLDSARFDRSQSLRSRSDYRQRHQPGRNRLSERCGQPQLLAAWADRRQELCWRRPCRHWLGSALGTWAALAIDPSGLQAGSGDPDGGRDSLISLCRRRTTGDLEHETAPRWLVALGFFGVGIYGGFIQAGVGFLILGVLSMAGFDLVRGNAIKVATVLAVYRPGAGSVRLARSRRLGTGLRSGRSERPSGESSELA